MVSATFPIPIPIPIPVPVQVGYRPGFNTGYNTGRGCIQTGGYRPNTGYYNNVGSQVRVNVRRTIL